MANSTKQLTLPDPNDPLDSRIEGAFGEKPGWVSGEEQLAFSKELSNKVAWVIGSAYKRRYSGKHGPVQDYAWRIVKAILRDHGYQI